MASFFRSPRREQSFLLPPSMKEWLPNGDFTWFLLDAVSVMDLSIFRRGYSKDGRGQPAYEPDMMVSILLYAYAHGERSSRKIERLCERDIAFRIIAGNLKPDHTSFAGFRKRFENEIKTLFLKVLLLCKEAGLTKAGVIAIDGTKMAGNASMAANRTREGLEEEITRILKEAEAKDTEENKLYGEKRGDELPKDLQDPQSRLSRVSECLARVKAKEAALEAERVRHDAERKAKETASGKKLRGRKPKDGAKDKAPKANPTDPESRIMKTARQFIQGYNAQAAANKEQVILAAEVTQDENDQKQLHPIIEKVAQNLTSINEATKIGITLADAGYATATTLNMPVPKGVEVIMATMKDWKERKAMKEKPAPRGRIPAMLPARERMQRKRQTKRGQRLYRLRGQIIEPVFGQIKSARGIDQFSRRGLNACDSEWKLICATHNLLKLWRKGAKLSKKECKAV